MIGRVALLTSYYHDDCFPDPARGATIENLLSKLCWCNHTALGGGYLVAAGIHAVDVAMWIAGEVPQSATGHGSRRRANAQGDTDDCYALSFRFPNGTIMAHTGEHMPNHSGFKSGCIAYGQTGCLEANYAGKVFIRGVEDAWNGGELSTLYTDGMQSNVRTFHKSITEGICTNPTVEPSVNSTLATILGRQAGQQGRTVTYQELLKDTRRLEVDLTGLKA
jgi:predicted dehydrogenase